MAKNRVDRSLTVQPAETTLYSLSAAPPTPSAPGERREGDRHMTLFRVGSLIVDGRRELCLIKNISAGGMMVRVYSPVDKDSQVQIELKCGQPISGRICWSRGDQVGMAFDEPVDVIDLLASAANGPRPRMPRVAVETYATVRQGARSWRVRCCDVSQGGVKIECSELFETQGDAVISLPDMAPQPGVIRWQADGYAGITFNRVLPLIELVDWLQARKNAQNGAQ